MPVGYPYFSFNAERYWQARQAYIQLAKSTRTADAERVFFWLVEAPPQSLANTKCSGMQPFRLWRRNSISVESMRISYLLTNNKLLTRINIEFT